MVNRRKVLRWRCEVRKGCSGKIFTDEKLNYISSVDHTHEPSLRSIIRKKSSMKSGMMLELPTNYKRYYCESVGL
jgi:hypothetical protein